MNDRAVELDNVSEMDDVRVDLLAGPHRLAVNLNGYMPNGSETQQVKGTSAALDAPKQGD